MLREGINVVIAGQPNAGKSSLLNALAGAELAIVTPIAGTTRDKVQQTIQIEGVPLHVIDTAGLRDSQDEVERIGIARAWDAIAGADVVLFLHDLTRCGLPDYQSADDAIARAMTELAPVGAGHPGVEQSDCGDCAAAETGVRVSARTGAGWRTCARRCWRRRVGNRRPRACISPARAM